MDADSRATFWRCAYCRSNGLTIHHADSTLWDVMIIVEDDHRAVDPDCADRNGVALIHIKHQRLEPTSWPTNDSISPSKPPFEFDA